MKCPSCKKEGLKYTDDRNKKHYVKHLRKKEKRNTARIRHKKADTKKQDRIKPRTEFNAKCKKCGWEGIL